MNSKNMITIKILVILMFFATRSVFADDKGIEGDWQLILTGLGQSFPLRISIQPDGTLTATSQGIPLNKITFESGKLHFEGGSPLCIFDGTIKEDGLTIEGKLKQTDQQWPALLQRVKRISPKSASQDDGETGQARDQKIQDRNKLIAWWKLDEADGNDVADSSGHNHVGRLVGNPQWQPIGGKIGGALAFDGMGDYVEIEDEPAFDFTSAVTITAWIKVNRFDRRWQTIVAKGDTAWRFQRAAEENGLAFHCTGITSVTGRWSEGIEGKKNVNDGQWHHAAGVYDGVNMSLYIDGVLDNSSEVSGVIQVNDLAVIIGGNSEQIGREWNGLIDEVCIINGAIDANAVHALYSGENPATVAQTAKSGLQSPDRLVAWWKFDDDPNDSAGINHGTIHGNSVFVEGKIDRAIRLDGDGYVDCGNPDSLNFGTGDWTISVWIKTTQSGTNPENRGTVFANGGDEAGGIRYALAANEEYLGTIVLTTDNDQQKVQAIGRTVVNDGVWHHVVGMRSAGQLQVYVDDVLDGSSYLPVEYDLSGVSQHNAYIGAAIDHRDESLFKYFVGLIDEVCIIRGSIDADGVRSLFSGENPVTVAQTAIRTRPAQAASIEFQPKSPQVTGGTGNIVTTLILILALVGVIGGIVLFFMKSSIRR